MLLATESPFSLSSANSQPCHSGELATLTSKAAIDASLSAWGWIVSACRQGSCGNCKARLAQGDVGMRRTRNRQPGEREKGFVLVCSGWPKGLAALDA